MSLRERLLGRFRHGFLRNVLVLFAGTSVAQLIPILASVVLTRLYTPADFGVFGLFTAVLSICAVAVCMRYEHAVLIESEDAESLQVARSSLVIAMVVAVVAAIAVLLGRHAIATALEAPALASALSLLPLAIALTGVLQIWSLRLLREQRFAVIARSRVLQSLAVAVVGIGLGMLDGNGVYLVGATLAGLWLAVSWLWRQSKGVLPLPRIAWAQMKPILLRHRRFPSYTVPADLLSAGAAQLPMFLLGPQFGTASVGAFVLTQRVLGLPLSVVGSAVMDAYKGDAAAAYAATGDCRALTLRIIKHLLALVVIPWLLVIILAPFAFRILFGSEWVTAGVLCQLLATPLFLRLITTPISYNFYLSGRQGEDLAAQGYNLLSNAVLIVVCVRLKLGLTATMAVYAANLSLVYGYYLCRSVVLSRRPRSPAAVESPPDGYK